MDGIRLDMYFIHDTYGGCYEGRPSDKETVESQLRLSAKLWGEGRNVHLFDTTPKRRCCMAWLSSPSIDCNDENCSNGGDWNTGCMTRCKSCNGKSAYHGFHLFLIWFEDSDPIKPLERALQIIEENGGWD